MCEAEHRVCAVWWLEQGDHLLKLLAAPGSCTENADDQCQVCDLFNASRAARTQHVRTPVTLQAEQASFLTRVSQASRM